MAELVIAETTGKKLKALETFLEALDILLKSQAQQVLNGRFRKRVKKSRLVR